MSNLSPCHQTVSVLIGIDIGQVMSWSHRPPDANYQQRESTKTQTYHRFFQTLIIMEYMKLETQLARHVIEDDTHIADRPTDGSDSMKSNRKVLSSPLNLAK